MNPFKYIPKFLSRNSSGLARPIMIGKSQQKFWLSTAIEASSSLETEPILDTNQTSMLNLFSIGTCMSPMRASKVFINHLKQHDILQKVHTLRVGNKSNTKHKQRTVENQTFSFYHI